MTHPHVPPTAVPVPVQHVVLQLMTAVVVIDQIHGDTRVTSVTYSPPEATRVELNRADRADRVARYLGLAETTPMVRPTGTVRIWTGTVLRHPVTLVAVEGDQDLAGAIDASADENGITDPALAGVGTHRTDVGT